MMAFQPLPILNEGDEQLCLTDVLAFREGPLNDLELWAVCKQCLNAVEELHSSLEMYQTLCITPDTLAFDSNTGHVSFLETATGKYRQSSWQTYCSKT